MINIALIGAGDVVRKSYLPALESRNDCKIVGICSRSRQSASKLAAGYGIENVYSSYMDILENEVVDTIFICTPTHLHREIAEAAMNYNKNVLIEKPLCTNYKDSHILLSRATNYTKSFYVTFNNQFRSENAWLKKRVLSGSLGEIELIDLEWYRSGFFTNKPWLYNQSYSGGGVLIDLGTHLIHWALSLIPNRHKFSVSCNTVSHNLPNSNVEDTAIAMITINGIHTIQLKLGWDVKLEQNSRVKLEILGSRSNTGNYKYNGEKTNPFILLIDDFFRHIEAKTKPDLSLIDDTMILIDSLYRSDESDTMMKGKFNNLL